MTYMLQLLVLYSLFALGLAGAIGYSDWRSLKGGGIEPIAALMICVALWPLFLLIGAASIMGERSARRSSRIQ